MVVWSSSCNSLDDGVCVLCAVWHLRSDPRRSFFLAVGKRCVENTELAQKRQKAVKPKDAQA